MISCVRAEKWGRVAYDRDSDEFESHVLDPDAPLIVSGPLSVGCLVTGRCNLSCEFCYGDEESLPRAELSVRAWRDIFTHLTSWGLMRVDLSGGEPTIRRDLSEIAGAAVGV